MALRIDVQIDNTELLKRVPKYEKRLLFGTISALRKTALRVQQAEFENVGSKFIVRRPQFLFGSPARPGGAAAKLLFPSVSKSRLYAEVYVEARGSKAGPVLLPHFEAGGTRKPHTPGAKQIAVPWLGGPARPNIAREVVPRYSFPGLRLRAFVGQPGKRLGTRAAKRKRRGGETDVTLFTRDGRFFLPERGGVSWRGQERSFLIPGQGVYQRIGPGQRYIRPIHVFIPPFPLNHPKLEFVETARRTTDAWFKEEMEREIVSSLTRARS